MQIHTYIINLQSRIDRKENVLKEFFNKDEFLPIVVNASQHVVGAIGLWQSIRGIVELAIKTDEEFIIICEDDHKFTPQYSFDFLQKAISKATELNADIISGGASWFNGAIKVSKNLYWLERFSGTQFLVVFKSFFQSILNADFSQLDNADYKICQLTQNRFMIVPYISVQIDFGYSDATPKNDKTGIVENLFRNSCNCIGLIEQLSTFYQFSLRLHKQSLTAQDINCHQIPTYLLISSEQPNHLEQLELQFREKDEFLLTIIRPDRNELPKLNLWSNMQKAVKLSILNEDDVMIICWGNHEFSNTYSKGALIHTIIQAHALNADLLFTGAQDFDLALQPTSNLVWTNRCSFSPFIILFKKFFGTVINEEVDESRQLQDILAEMSLNKFLTSPLISKTGTLKLSQKLIDLQMNPKYKTQNSIDASRRVEVLREAFERLQLIIPEL